MKSNCEVCNSSKTKVYEIRDGLSYTLCSSCSHCLLVPNELSYNQQFSFSQDKYFGESNVLVSSRQTPFEEESLNKRIQIFNEFVKSKKHILEVGPGAGSFLNWLVKENHKVTAVEDSLHLVETLKRIPNSRIFAGTFEQFTPVDETFDVLCSFHVIEHVIEPKKFLKKALSLLNKEGLAFIATPNATSWEQKFFRKLSPNFDRAHLRVFSVESLSLLAKDVGWEVLHVETPEYTNGWLRIISKALRKLRNEDEENTAGKYQIGMSKRSTFLIKAIRVLTSPIRILQSGFSGGNEILLVLKKSN